MTAIRSGIPTTYRFGNFRSRLEARWAVLFDLVGWRWTYEPIDLAGYVPDFLIHGERPLLVEVGPCATSAEYVAKSQKARNVDLPYDLIVVGVSPIRDFAGHGSGWGSPSAGEMLEVDDTGEKSAGHGLWHQCGKCGAVAIHHDEMTWAGRPCGHYDGDHYLSRLEVDLEALWAEAGNRTQWKPS